ncbi:MAG: hypothetical protein AAF590_04310 [Pseudomonadota bacterium]
MTDTFQTSSAPRKASARQSINRFYGWAGLVVMGAAIVHVIIVFALPSIGRAVLIETVIPPDETVPRLYTFDAGEPLPNFRYADARTDSVYCSFDLRDGAVRVSGDVEVPFWSISVHTLSGLVVGSVNHNAATGGRLDLIVMRPSLARDLAEAGAELPRDSLVVEMDGPIGLARVSGLATYEALRPQLRADLAETECMPATFTFTRFEDTPAEIEEEEAPLRRLGPPSVPQPAVRPNF